MKYLLLTFVAFFMLSCNENLQKKSDIDINGVEEKKLESKLKKDDNIKVLKTSSGKEVPVYNYEQFSKTVLSRKEPNQTYVVNFWATWCKPCVAELPYFFELETELKDKNVNFVYVSFDFMKSLETALIPFLENRKIESEVVVLDQKGINEWLPEIDAEWSGAIPATLIFNSNKRLFMETNFESADELKKELEAFL